MRDRAGGTAVENIVVIVVSFSTRAAKLRR
jgi:hypothetical protein